MLRIKSAPGVQKRMNLRLLFFIIIISCVMLAGCSNEEQKLEQNPDEDVNNVEEVSSKEPEAKENAEELDYERFAKIDINDTIAWMNVGAGEFPGDEYNEDRVKAEIDTWSEDMEPEEYFHRILALTAEDYRKYQELLDNIEVEFEDVTARPDEVVESDVEQEEQTTLHIQVLLDASGSMAGQVDGGVKMDLAKEAISDFAAELPNNAQVSLRVYGHKGSNQLEGKEESCANTEEVYALGEYNESEFETALNEFGPTGYTPIAAAIDTAGKDLTDANEEGVQSVVYVVSDGEETCGGDPVAAAAELQKSDIGAIVNIIGFDIEESEREALEAIADAGAGEYFRADTAQELQDTLRAERTALIEDWNNWVNENVSQSQDQVNKYLDQSYEYSDEALDKSNVEQERQLDLTYYMEEIAEDVNTIEIRQLIRNRAIDIRQHVRSEYLDIRQEARKKGLDIRQGVRKEGLDERQELREQNRD